MKCKNCTAQTAFPNQGSISWRQYQLCPICAFEKYPKIYPKPLMTRERQKQFGEESGSNVGRYADDEV